MKHNDLLFTDEGVLLSNSTKICTITYKDIVCFITDRPYIAIETKKKERIHIQTSIIQIAKSLPDCFCMCSQSAIVNLAYVDKYEEKQHVSRVCLKNTCIVQVSRRYRKILKMQIMSFKKMNCT